MPSRNIAVRKDVYDSLQREKRGGESFTQVLLRMLTQRAPLEELRGSWGPAPKDEGRRLAALRPVSPRGRP
jgi:predicted CopG family antitoxin